MRNKVMDTVRAYLLNLPRRQKRTLQVVTDCMLVWLALWMAFAVRLGIDEMNNPLTQHVWLFIAAPVVAIPLFVRFGMYRAVMRYFGNDALVAIFKAVTRIVSHTVPRPSAAARPSGSPGRASLTCAESASGAARKLRRERPVTAAIGCTNRHPAPSSWPRRASSAMRLAASCTLWALNRRLIGPKL